MKKPTLINLFEDSVSKYGNNTMLLEKHGSEWLPTTYSEAHGIVLEIAGGLIETGVKKSDKIAILSEGRNDWILSELGLLYAGALSVPLSVKLEESNDLLFRLQHGEVTTAFVSNLQLDKIRSIRESLPLLKSVVVYDDVKELQEGEMTLNQLRESGRGYSKEQREQIVEEALKLKDDHCATISYTSGTTADPKGVMLTHRNYTANVEQCLRRVPVPPTYRTLIILPLDHCFAHVVGFYIMIHSGATIATVQVGKSPFETIKNIPTNILEIEPDYLLFVPALAKTFHRIILRSVEERGKLVESLFKLAIKVSYLYNKDGKSKGSGASIMLKPLVAMFDKLLYSKIREAFGRNLKFIISGGALLDTELQRFFYAIGAPIYQGYGLSEATPVISTNTAEEHRLGSSGKLIEPLEVRIVDENGKDLPPNVSGEVVVRGENIMAGYWKNEKATEEVLRDGWLHTGDLGYVTPDGYLNVSGRFKSLLISSDGEKYSPEEMEETIPSISPFIEQVLFYNDHRQYTSALVVPNIEEVRKRAKRSNGNGDEAMAAVKLIADELNRFKRGGEYAELFPERWMPATFALVSEPFSEENGLINSTAKVVRTKVEETYRDRIEYMYTPEGKDVFNERNLRVFNCSAE